MSRSFFTGIAAKLANATDVLLGVRRDGLDLQDLFQIKANGTMEWGSGSTGRDTNLYRNGADQLKTDDAMAAVKGFINPVTSGAPTDTLDDGTIAVDTTNDALYFRSGGAWVEAGGGGTSPISVCKSTTQVTNNSNTTPTDITGLVFALTAGTMYHFKFIGEYRSAATTTGIGFTFTAPAVTYGAWNVQIQQAAAGTDMMYTNTSTSFSTVLVSASVVSANTDYMWEVEGYIQPSASGNLQLRVRSETTSQVTIVAGSCGILTTIG